MPLYNDDAHRSVGLGCCQRIGHGLVHGGVDGVFFVNTVDGQRHHARVKMGQNFSHYLYPLFFKVNHLVGGGQQQAGFRPQLRALVEKAVEETLCLGLAQHKLTAQCS